MGMGTGQPGFGIGQRRLRGSGALCAAILVIGLAATGCSGASQGESIAPESATSGRSDSLAADTGGDSRKTASEVSAAQRSVIQTADLQLDVDDLPGATARVRQLSTGAGGHLAQEDSSPAGASLVVKVPSERLDRVLDELTRIGEVTARSRRAEDVTEQMVDVRSRIDSQRASVQRLRALLGEARDVQEIVAIEGELTSRESELDSLERRRTALSGQVELATITVRLDAPERVADEGNGGFLDGLASGWRALTAFGAYALTVLGVVVPFAVFLAFPVGAAWLLWRRRRLSRSSRL